MHALFYMENVKGPRNIGSCGGLGGGGTLVSEVNVPTYTIPDVGVPTASVMAAETSLHFPRKKVHLSDMTAVYAALAGALALSPGIYPIRQRIVWKRGLL